MFSHRKKGALVAERVPGDRDHPALISPASRREFLKSLGALGATAILPGAAGLAAQMNSPAGSAGPRRIDVHQHMFSPAYLSRVGKPQTNPRADPLMKNWTPERAIEELDRTGIATAVLSIAVAGISFDTPGEESRSLARGNNEYGAQLVRDHPQRFGLFASVPLPDQEGSLREIEYAYDTLHADGIALTTNYGEKWPGDPAFAPVFEELNRRKAVVFVHPIAPTCCKSLIPGVPPSWVEYDFDTTRAVASFIVNGTFERFPDIRFIITHSGGTVPVLAARVQGIFQPGVSGQAPGSVEAQLRKLFYDIANGANPMSLAALTKLVPTSQILFGTDFPMVRIGTTVNGFRNAGFPPNEVRAIDRENALRLLPRLNGHG
jgi:predicted TIM-barrel fold metal-dependent hydrolase